MSDREAVVALGEAIRSQFPSLARTQNGRPVVYLDGPGGSQVPEPVIDAISHYYRTSNANTHGAFVTSQETDAVIAGARAAMADFLHAPAGATISFGANMTTLNFALAHAVARRLKPGDEVVVTEIDHEGNVSPWLMLSQYGMVVRWAPLADNRIELDLPRLLELIGPRTRLVALNMASNAIGTVTPVDAVRRRTREVGALLVLDAVHYAPHLPIDVAALNPDFLLCSAYKFFGPHVGVLYGAPGALAALEPDRVRPQDPVGPTRIETGTLNHAALAGVTAAVETIAAWAGPSGDRRERLTRAMEALDRYEAELFRRLYDGLKAIPGVQLYGRPPERLVRTPTAGFTLAGADASTVAAGLAARGIFAWSGDFYATTLVERLGLAKQGGLVRLGLAPYNTAEEMDRTVEAMRDIQRHL